ncbi:MAG: formate--tetrahydrofolate ligase [Gemmatimonadaceae bacterium]|jgi:formate--tetrahydrofolate ligase|nr:formate--tetrahydrofolate ligase [Gemmatimonadaceae bacterium]
MTAFPSDIEIAQRATPRPITDVAADLGIAADVLHPYGRFAAKLPLSAAERPARGRLVLVTAINPTTAGEGKTTTTVGVTQALRRLGHHAVLCMRQPSLGPVFGVKGGAAGGGYAQVLPMEEINLHFTGDFHAVTAAHALLSALLDNHLHHGNARALDPRRITWPRAVDMNDRALRQVTVGLGGVTNGPVREERFVITSASEVMAVLALARDAADLEARLARIIVGTTGGATAAQRTPVRAGELGAAGAMALLLKDAIRPNLVQTLEGGPALVHAGPFANIAHGCNSLIATRTALAHADLVLTEAGFGADLGAEKFFHIKCRTGGLDPHAAILVASVRALKLNGGAPAKGLATEDLAALDRGMPNLGRHIGILRKFGVPVVVAVNRFPTDTDAELDRVLAAAAAHGVRAAISDVFTHGGAGGEAVAHALLATLAAPHTPWTPLYDPERPIAEKLETIVQQVYGGAGIALSPKAARAIEWLEANGMGHTPVCMAKTQYSFSADASQLGAPSGFTVPIADVTPSAGAGFVVASAGDIMTMPGLPVQPAAMRMHIDADGAIHGLF